MTFRTFSNHSTPLQTLRNCQHRLLNRLHSAYFPIAVHFELTRSRLVSMHRYPVVHQCPKRNRPSRYPNRHETLFVSSSNSRPTSILNERLCEPAVVQPSPTREQTHTHTPRSQRLRPRISPQSNRPLVFNDRLVSTRLHVPIAVGAPNFTCRAPPFRLKPLTVPCRETSIQQEVARNLAELRNQYTHLHNSAIHQS